MLFAKIVLGLAVEGPFDYSVPESLKDKISLGKRVWVNFCNSKKIGFCVDLTSQSKIKYHKPVLEVIDEFPVLNKNMLLLTKKLSDYYCCFWGEAIETALPEGIRKGRRMPVCKYPSEKSSNILKPQRTLLHDLSGIGRWDFYLEKIKNTLENNYKVIVILPDVASLQEVKEKIESSLNVKACLLYRHGPYENELWARIACGQENIVIGTRSAIFAPLPNLGLIIIDEEQDTVYKQDQVPHYHAREIALLRSEIEKTNLILGSTSPSLESFLLLKKGKFDHLVLPRGGNLPEIKFIDLKNLSFAERKKSTIFSNLLEDSIYSVLSQKGKSLLFINRKGYSSLAACLQCQAVLKCPRCSINLTFYFHENKLKCHYCNFKMEAPKICPSCNSGYIKFSGTGTEKIENELARLFPQARIACLDNRREIDLEKGDIFIATSSILRRQDLKFDLVGVVAIDNSLNLADLRSGEKTFHLLSGLLNLTQKKLIIQTSFVTHQAFQAIWKNDPEYFYQEELKQRKQLKFPPFEHLIKIKLRGIKDEKVKDASNRLFERLQVAAKEKLKVLSVGVADPHKLRGNFCWQIMLIAHNIKKASDFLKKELKDFAHSGIIVTVDVDPL
ncbi:MAG: primosomal protein N' [Candidatus Omnitrophica bacterium]|nr:primosomal protein N' [Candidatus Omnitrophota bacterium]